MVLAARENGVDAATAAAMTSRAVGVYRDELAALMGMTALERYYDTVDTSRLQRILAPKQRRRLERVEHRAQRRTSEQVLGKVTVTGDHDQRRIVDQPPLLQHRAWATVEKATRLLGKARATQSQDVALLLSQFEVVDASMRVVGVGSVGTRSYLVLLQGLSDEPLFLQAKEANASVLVSHGGVAPLAELGMPRTGPAGRVVAAQRILQGVSDPFLGWVRSSRTSFYLRQYRDGKLSIDLANLRRKPLETYVAVCARQLARAHAQSPTAGFVDGYLGRSDVFPDAVAAWSVAYAGQVERDYEALEHAASDGRITVETGI